jgi:hypothetical protein
LRRFFILSTRVLHQVFFDPSGRRGYVVSAMYWAICTLLGVVMACLLATSIDGPSLPSLHLSDPQDRPGAGERQ